MLQSTMVAVLLGSVGISSWISQSLLDSLIILTLIVLTIKYRINFLKIFRRLPLFVTFSLFGYFITAVLGYMINARSGAEALPNLAKFSWILQLFLFIWAAQSIDWTVQMTKQASKVIKFFIWVSLIPSIYALNIFLLGGVDIITLQQTGYRVVGFVNSATYHGAVGGMIFIFSLVLITLKWNELNRDLKIMSPIFLTLTFTSSVLTMTRGVWISLASSVLVFGFALKKWKILIFIFCFAMLSLFTSYPRQLLENRSGSDNCRLKLIETHVRIFQAYPILGIGYRDNLREIKDFWPEAEIGRCAHLRNFGNHAHNQYLNVLATTGLLGLIFFVIFHSYFLFINIRLVKNLATNNVLFPISLGCLLVQVFFLTSNITETSFEYGKVRSVLLLIWGISFVIYQNLNLKKLQPDSD